MSIGPGQHPLDALEATLAAGLQETDDRARQKHADEFAERLDAAHEQGGLAPRSPRPEPGSARGSTAELVRLAAVFGLVPLPEALVQRERSRAGYTLTGDPDDEHARAEPGFAAALATAANQDQSDPAWARHLATRFDDLWAVDMSLWRALTRDSASPRRLAELWLRSPGRRLVRDLDVIKELGTGRTRGAAATDLDALRRAAGIDALPYNLQDLRAWLDSAPPRWRDLHAAVPGLLLRAWEPRDRRVTTALRRLDRPSPHSVRGAALTWLLDRAATDPFYEIDGIRRDLRDDLPVRLAAALSDDSSPEPAISAELEATLLRHAAHITARAGRAPDDPDAILAAWSLSRWMHRCLIRSPFYGADEDSLTARLRALFGKHPPRPGRDPLHPARFGPENLDIADIALLAGIMGHYGHPGPHLEPVPLPLIHALRRMAGRRVRQAEAQAEAALPPRAPEPPQRLGIPGNALGWNTPHIAPPWVARRFLTDKRIAWLAKQSDPAPVIDECLDALHDSPDKFSWLGFAFYLEGHELSPALQARAASAWRDLAGPTDSAAPDEDEAMPAQALAAMAAGLLPQLDAADHGRALDIAACAPEDWRPFLFDAHAEAALRALTADGHSQDESSSAATDAVETALRRALDRLLAAVEDPACSTRARLNSALMVLRRATAWRSEAARPYLQRLAAATGEPPFRDHRALQREIRRLGLHAVLSRP